MQIDTRYTPLVLTNSANVTASSVTEPTPTGTPPNGDGVISMGCSGGPTQSFTFGATLANSLKLIPIGAGSSTNTFTMKVYGWDLTVPGGLSSGTWVPHLLASFTCTLCTQTGVANTDVVATQLFCGTIALVAGNANVSNEVLSPTGNVIAHIILDAKGCALVECRFGTGGSATSCNCLAKRL